MISCGLNKDFAVIAADSARYEKGLTSFETQKLMHIKKYLVTFIGVPMYLEGLKDDKFNLDLIELCAYLYTHFKTKQPDVVETMQDLIEDPDDQKANLCFFLLGVNGGAPALVQFNSFKDFTPDFLYAEPRMKFSSIFYGDDRKRKLFDDSSDYVTDLSKKYAQMTPGIVGEILTKGIYFKSDLEEEIFGQKYSGGPVSTAMINKDGTITSLSNILSEEKQYGSRTTTAV